MKKIVYLFCSAFLLSGISLSAMQQTAAKNHGAIYYQNHEERMKKVEGHLQMDTRYYDHLSSYAANMYLVGEFLYWTGENGGFATCFDTADDDNTVFILNRDFDYGPGFRVGLGFKPPVDWDMFFSYTHFHHTSKEKHTGNLYPYGVPMRGQMARLKSSFKTKYDMLDVEFGRFFHVGNTLAFKPFFGARGGWIKQKGLSAGYDAFSVPSPGDPTTPLHYSHDEKLWVIGPRAGFDADLFFSKNYGFSLFGKFSGALLYGQASHRYYSFVTQYQDDPQIQIVIEKDRDDLIASLQCAAGISWGDFLTEGEDVALCLRVGWEANYWWDMYSPLQFFYFEPDERSLQTVSEALLMQGLTVSARLDF